MSKRVKIENNWKAETLDLTSWYESQKKQKLEEQERKRKEEALEQERIDKINCPVCKSTDKIHHIKRNSNGIMGSGHSSWITDEYLICKGCGIHYSDIKKSL